MHSPQMDGNLRSARETGIALIASVKQSGCVCFEMVIQCHSIIVLRLAEFAVEPFRNVSLVMAHQSGFAVALTSADVAQRFLVVGFKVVGKHLGPFEYFTAHVTHVFVLRTPTHFDV